MAQSTKKIPTDDLLDWTITHAPTDDELPLAPPEQAVPDSPAPRPSREPPPLNWIKSYLGTASGSRSISRQTGLMLGGLILVSLLTVWLYPMWNRYRLQRDVARIVTLEDQAALSGDVDQLHQLSEDGDGGWLSERDQLATLGQVVSPPTRLLRPAREPGVVQSFTLLTTNTARADVARQFSAPDGTTLTFTLPQFYRFTQGAWKRIPPPEDALGGQLTRTSMHADIQYYAADAAFVEKDLAPYLDDVLARACAVWDCPDDPKITISIDSHLPASPMFYPEWGWGDGPLLFQLSPVRFSRWPHDTLLVGSPSAVGYPTDTASAGYLRRVIAVQALFVAADQITFTNDAHDKINNSFLYALVARMTAWLGLDSPHVIDRTSTPSTRTADDIWQSDPFFADADADARRALAMLNWLLRDQPAQAESLLFHALGSREINNPVDWLAAGLNISEDEARARLDAAATGTYRLKLDYALAALPPAHYDLALGCDRGPALFSLSTAQPVYFLHDYHASANVLSWSPDGQRLVVDLSGQPTVVDFAARAVYALPDTSPGKIASWQWISNSLVAHTDWLTSTQLIYFDAANPQSSPPPIPGIMDYVLSPDKTTALVIREKAGGFLHTEIDRMPALGGQFILEQADGGQSPSWSPDGRAIAYVHYDETNDEFSVQWTGRDGFLFREKGIGIFGQTVWSASGDKIAFTAANEDSSEVWLGIVSSLAVGPNGFNPKLLLKKVPFASQPRFSADGKYLAVSIFREGSLPEAIIYDTTTAEQLATLPHVGDYDWSPTGRQLVTVAFDGVYLFAEPGDPQSSPKKLLNGACYSVRWNPAP